MRRALLVLALALAVAPAPAAAAATATPTASPSPSPSQTTSGVASPARTSNPAPTPSTSTAANASVIASLRARIGNDLADSLVKQQKLSDALSADTARGDDLQNQVSAAEDRIVQLQDQIAQLDTQIQDTQDRVDVEKAQVGALTRALARRPDSVLLAFARSRSLADALRTGTDLMVAGHRAHALQSRLEGDLERLNSERDARQLDVDRQTALAESLQSELDNLTAAVAREQDVAGALSDLLDQFQQAMQGLGDPSLDLAQQQQLVAMLEQQQQSISEASISAAWSAAAVGAGSVQVLNTLSHVKVDATLLTPIAGAVMTQPFGPTTLWFEPPLGQYPHFHAGVDLAAPPGTPVVAAGDGVVAAVGSTSGGYGRYVVIAHGRGLMTLYGHLESFTVTQGQTLKMGYVIGAEGSTGLSTGPHLHFEVRVDNTVVDPAGYITLPPAATN